MEQKEHELREDMRKAMSQADAAEKAAENPGSYAEEMIPPGKAEADEQSPDGE